MRGFVVALDCHPETGNTMLDLQLAQWEKSFSPGCLTRTVNPGCRVYLFTRDAATPVQFNQKIYETSEGIRLWIGPRVDITDEVLLLSPLSADFDKFFSGISGLPFALDTAIVFNYCSPRHSLLVRTDPLNSTFIYYTRTARYLLLSNSSLTLAQLIGAPVNWVAASEFLASGCIYGNYSLYEGIRSLKPAHLYEFTQTTSRESEYWTLSALLFNTLSASEACQRIVEELDKDFASLNASGRNFVLDLTAGYDSRTNVGFAIRNLKNFQTTVSGAPGDEDVVLSSHIARHFGFKHVVTPFLSSEDSRQLDYIARAAWLTDLEYDVIQYSQIYNAQTQFDTLNQPSIHGSAGGDIARNIILRREFCDPSPEGRLVLEPLIEQRFRNLIPSALGLSHLPIADWFSHMCGRIAEHDHPELPAFARLDILYLRMRMQFWQGRIGSSTNRFRSSFSPWTNRRVMETMLITKWKEKRRQMLSRLFLAALHPDLARLPVARGEAAGPTAWSTLVALPARMRYFAGRVGWRLGWNQPRIEGKSSVFDHFGPKWEAVLGNLLRPEAAKNLKASRLLDHPLVLGRLVTLAHLEDSLKLP